MKFDLLLEQLFKDLRSAYINKNTENTLGLKRDFIERLDKEFNQLQVCIFCALYDWMAVGGLLPEDKSIEDSPETKVMFMSLESNGAKMVRNFSFEDEFDEMLHLHNVSEMVEFLEDFPNDYDPLHAEYRRAEAARKYEPFLRALIDKMLDTNSPAFDPRFHIKPN